MPKSQEGPTNGISRSGGVGRGTYTQHQHRSATTAYYPFIHSLLDSRVAQARCSPEFQVRASSSPRESPGDAGAKPGSGTASQELQAEFNSLLASDDTFGLLATIEKESLVPVATIPSASSSDFAENLRGLEPHVKPDEALYIILRRFDSTPRLLAVTYVPDGARVRQKMLFASTRLALVRELGSEHFRETIFVTTAAELTAKGFEKHDAHNKLDAPLTQEEKTLGEVKRAEQEAGAGTGTREIHLSKSLAMPVAEDAIAALKDVGEGGRSVVMLVSNPVWSTGLPKS